MRHLTHDGVTFGFQDVGKGAPPIVLVHDRGASHTSFAPQVERLRGSHRIVAVELPADCPERPSAAAARADGLAWLLYELGIYLPVVVGLGFGGRVALALAERHPDLPAGLVLVGLPGLVDPPAEDDRLASESLGIPRTCLSGVESADQLSAAIEAFAAQVRSEGREARR